MARLPQAAATRRDQGASMRPSTFGTGSASIRPSTFAVRPDWVGRLRQKEYGTKMPRDQVRTFYGFPEHEARWVKVFGNEAGRSQQEAAAFAIEEGCRMVLSLPTPDAIERDRAVIEKYGTPLQQRAVKALAFSVTRPNDYIDLKKFSVRLTESGVKALTAVECKLHLTETAPLAIALVLVDVPALPGEVREGLYADAKRALAYLEATAQELKVMAGGLSKRHAGSDVTMGDLLKKARKH